MSRPLLLQLLTIPLIDSSGEIMHDEDGRFSHAIEMYPRLAIP